MDFVHGVMAHIITSYQPRKRQQITYRWHFRIPILSFFFPFLDWEFGPKKRKWITTK